MPARKKPFKAESIYIPDHIRELLVPFLQGMGLDERIVCEWLATLALSSHLQSLSALGSLARWMGTNDRWVAGPCGPLPDMAAYTQYLADNFAPHTCKLYTGRIACFLRYVDWKRENHGQTPPPCTEGTEATPALVRLCHELGHDLSCAETWALRRQRRYSRTTALRMLNRFAEWCATAVPDRAPTQKDVEEWAKSLSATYSYSHMRLHRNIVLAWLAWLGESGHRDEEKD